MKQTKTEDERRAYVRGAIEACQAMGVTPEVIASVCLDLRITGKEVTELGRECKADVKVNNHVPQVQS
jgi:hypothetical protein